MYWHILERCVGWYPWLSALSNGFVCPPEYVCALSEIERKVERGENINPYLSRKLPNLSANDELLNDWGIQHLHLGSSLITKKKNRGFIEGTPELLFVYFDEQSERKVERGENINPYLSRKLPNLSANDELLNDWGIQHLHLGSSLITKKKNRGFIEGTPELLFVYFDEQSAYFIVIGDHESFGDQELLEILHDNWPEILEKFKAPNIKSVIPDDLTKKQRYQMRKAGYNLGVNVMRDGTAYVMVGGGIMWSGDNTLDVDGTNRLHTWAHRQTNNLRDLVPVMAAGLRARHRLEIVESITLRLIVEGRFDSRWFLIDDNNHLTVGLGNPWENEPPMIFYFFDDSTTISPQS